MIMCEPVQFQGVEPVLIPSPEPPAEPVVVESLWLGVVEDE